MCKKVTFQKSRLAVKIDVVDVIHYLKQLFHLQFSKFNLAVQINFVEVDHYLKQVFHLLCNKSVTLAEALIYFSLILWIAV